MRETWYKLEDGRIVPPSEVAPDDSNSLVHKSGVPVAMKGSVPHTWNVDPDEERAKQAAPKAEERRDVRPETGGQGYKTRRMKKTD